ncbi:hypothetical protein TREMEDRAFT_63095 [Tremella mesenterica DSM 1558]|uniref:uncharacterized protein n=1 Tax=Tremella mesenterica (strain ATCC 24925 / CBS 8224 / DSM 1558 / NBRC 9311 / NRRL Y-6157 / RJB 2259-6 / UBC 559-6) TaxID=578456 RepID=UPI0003F49180|nr:uncharacterized protein TREMEDRAFT_63095 [Tremella mesenterica DSM 1558]EIW68628.1 hypothetical protein TREMEDRAFT_63095 [Tremella mesenterica DSM 1558]
MSSTPSAQTDDVTILYYFDDETLAYDLVLATEDAIVDGNNMTEQVENMITAIITTIEQHYEQRSYPGDSEELQKRTFGAYDKFKFMFPVEVQLKPMEAYWVAEPG